MIAVENLHFQQGRFALANLSFTISKGQYAVLMGKTGSGKTSILEAIAGLRPLQSGRVILADRDVTALPPAARGIGYVPQDGALFGTMTVRDQLAFALTLRQVPMQAIRQRVDQLAQELGVEQLLDRRPTGLSGGEIQRVALGRALSFRPGFLLLDEPLSSLDEETRGQIMDLLRTIHRREELTVLHVTHNTQEAEQLGTMILRLEAGRVRSG